VVGKNEIEKQKQKNKHVVAEKMIQKKPNKNQNRRRNPGKKSDGQKLQKANCDEERRRQLVVT
jgi:hypothetical protein